jgi:hypothetical protein
LFSDVSICAGNNNELYSLVSSNVIIGVSAVFIISDGLKESWITSRLIFLINKFVFSHIQYIKLQFNKLLDYLYYKLILFLQ